MHITIIQTPTLRHIPKLYSKKKHTHNISTVYKWISCCICKNITSVQCATSPTLQSKRHTHQKNQSFPPLSFYVHSSHMFLFLLIFHLFVCVCVCVCLGRFTLHWTKARGNKHTTLVNVPQQNTPKQGLMALHSLVRLETCKPKMMK